MPRPHAAPRFADRFRELLAERGISYRALAARTFHGKSYLHDLAAGRKTPSPDTVRRLDDALHARGELVALAKLDTASPTVSPLADGGGWHRRDAEGLAHLLTTSEPTAHDAVTLAHQWLIAEPPQVYELRAGRRIGHRTVDEVERRVRQLRRLDDHIGGAETYVMVSAELAATAVLLRDSACTEELGRRLLVAIGDLSQLAGFVAADAGRYADARRLYLAGVRAGHAADDQANAANNLSSLSYLEANVGNPRQAITLARSAYAGGRHHADPIGRALLLERVAWAHARDADAPGAERALSRVEDVYDPDRLPEAAPWAYWLTADEVETMAGRVWTQLHRPLRAVPILERTTTRYGDDVPRESALYLTWLAESLTQAGEVDRAADAATRALRLARRARSRRAVDRVSAVGRILTAAAGTSVVVAAFAEERSDLDVTATGE